MAEFFRGNIDKSDYSGAFASQATAEIREIQARLEVIVDRVLTIRRSVRPPAEQLARLTQAHQERFISSVEFLANTSVELAYNFCVFAPPALRAIDANQWQTWVSRLLEIYDAGGVIACVAEIQDVDRYAKSALSAPSSIRLEKIARVLEGFIRGLSGRQLNLSAAEEAYTDTESIFLPAQLALFKQRDDNFSLYKAMAVHLWAQTWFGTWRVNLVDLTQDYSDPNRAVRLFHALETLRLDACIERELPGMFRTMAALKSIATERIPNDSWIQTARRLRHEASTVHDSVALLPQVYADNEEPQAVCYQGILLPERVYEAMRRRIAREKEAFRALLKTEEDKFHRTHGPNKKHDRDQGSIDRGKAEHKFQLKSMPEEGKSGELRIVLEYDGVPVKPPDAARQLMDSILQDLPEIPEDYLVPAGYGAYRSNANKPDSLDTESMPKDGNYAYDEWDHIRQNYRKGWCQLRERAVNPKSDRFVEQTLQKHRGLLKHLHRTFEALREDDKRLKRQPFGDDIDIDAVVESYSDLRRGLECGDRLFIKMRKLERNIAVMFMVDMSGSTEGWINDMERESLVLLCESLEILGDRYAIYGFSGYTHKRCELFRIKHFNEPYNEAVKARISGIVPQDYTRMGVAIRHLTKLLADVEARTKLLITLSDGRPDDQDGYRGNYGIEDTRMALIEAKTLGIHPYCITIDNEALDYLPHMYGAVNFSLIDQVGKLPFKVSEIYRRITR